MIDSDLDSLFFSDTSKINLQAIRRILEWKCICMKIQSVQLEIAGCICLSSWSTISMRSRVKNVCFWLIESTSRERKSFWFERFSAYVVFAVFSSLLFYFIVVTRKRSATKCPWRMLTLHKHGACMVYIQFHFVMWKFALVESSTWSSLNVFCSSILTRIPYWVVC